jgi:hypothetical protein
MISYNVALVYTTLQKRIYPASEEKLGGMYDYTSPPF